MGDLARCSKYDKEYQRSLITTHREEIEHFLDDKKYLFFPEVILSASLQFDFKKYKGTKSVAPVTDIFSGKGFKSNVNGVTVKVTKAKTPKELSAGSGASEIAHIDLPEEELAKGLRLFRIDGNHRLSAAEDIDRFKSLPTPFCIVLHDDVTQATRFEKVVFHNINAKQVPLTSEENLRLILQEGDQALFTDQELLENRSFGTAYYLARKLVAALNPDYLPGLKKALDNPRSLALSLTQFLSAHDADLRQEKSQELDKQVVRLREAIKAVNAVYEKRTKLAENGCHGVLVAFTYFAIHNGGRQLPAFERWVVTNRIDHLAPTSTTQGIGYHYHLGRTQAVDPASLVNVFESIITARHREIFISMQFCEETKETYETIKKTVRQINDKHKLTIKLREIRIDHFNPGHSYTIDDEILKIIEGSGLLIADLTFGNRNVYHEIGYLMGLNRGKGLGQENFILIADKGRRGTDIEKDIGFNLKVWQQLRFESTRQLEENLTKSLEEYFGFNGESA